MSTPRIHVTARRLATAVSSALALATFGLGVTPSTASADGRQQPAGTVSVMALPLISPPVAPPPSAAMMPGPQSCGTSECVGDFVDACAAAGGVATETKTVMGPPDGLEVVCVPNASMPR